MTGAAAGPSGPAVAGAAGGGRALSAFATVLAVFTFLLLLVGGLVTSREAGLTVPDWPLSYGTINPPDWMQTPGVREEHGHRLIGWVLVGPMTILLAVWIQRSDPRAWMRRLGWTALGLVVLQGVIGGYFRVVLLQHRMAIVHGILGQGFFCVMVAIALFLSGGWRGAMPAEADPFARRIRRFSMMAAVAVYLQVVIGALIRHSGVGHLVEYLWPHIAWAVVTAALGLLCMAEALLRHGRRPDLVRPAVLLGGGVILQILLGVGAWQADVRGAEEIVRPSYQFWTATAHQSAGALVLAAAVVLHLRVRRLLRDPAPGEAPAAAPAGAVPARGTA